MAFNPELGSTSPAVLLDNAERLDKLVNGSALTEPDRAGVNLDTWRGMMAKNDEVRQNLIPLSKQYQTLAAAQADIANIPEGSTTYYRSPDDIALAIEVMNVGGTLQPTGRKMPSQEYVEPVDEYVTTRLFSEVLPGIPFLLQDEESGVIMFGEDSGATHVPGLSLKYGSDLVYSVTQIPGVAHVELDEKGNVLRWVDDSGETHDASPGSGAEPTPVAVSSPVISPQVYENALVSEIGYNQWINNVAVKFGRDYFFSGVRLGTTGPERILGNLAICRRQGERGKFGCYEFGPRAAVLGDTASTDDHDAPSILLDTRAGAEVPIQIFQSDHSGANVWLRKWSSQTLDPANISGPEVVSDTSNMTYAQSYRNPFNQNEILVFARRGSTNSARWVAHHSTDNGRTWQSNAFIGGSDLYMTTCQSVDGNAIHLAIQQHPRSTDTRVLYMKIKWSDKSLINYSGITALPDIMTYGYIDPFLNGIPDVVFEASLPTNTKRLFEVKDDGVSILFLIAEFNASNYSYRRMKMSQFSGGTPVIHDIGDCGSPMNNDDATFYVPGGTIISATDVLVCNWVKIPALGQLTRYVYDGSAWNGTLLDEVKDGRKICRPLVFREYYQDNGILKYHDTNTVVYLRGTYNAYRDFDLDAVLINI
ncbi:flagellar biosynthesis protein [Klebsiella pneumoniae]|uniref:flagellar biosynthesis protein n=2 Tax=Klebsiella pneumoniae TaxID=573 RepID=UPI00200AD905|nr:flagellar biosynthesis protein [Klebsiella pneumoniae]MDR7662090.1 flagellar biosynthesis protein [Klebsiella pneumoniae]HBS2581603.1 flagellar biosynthesis protein [Klebsiella pneumoniae]HBS2587277.1 flagellar biosynthesis protein [Klebsiella pneumoniae]HBS2592791.1 flagellar biosynthesis protein [Klebsiella pneumoniae]HBS2615026.1 flagellar biosynthesis protein [Klebsiella pneumoniae]